MSVDQQYKIILLVINLMSYLPRGVLNFISDALGMIWFNLDKRHRNVVLKNISSSYPDEFSDQQINRMVKKIFKNIASIPMELIWSFGKSQEELFKYFEVKGIEHINNAKQKGNGVIILTGHIGNFELLVASMEKAGVEGHGIYRKFDFEPLERLMLMMRQRFGGVMIAMGGMSRKIDELLEKGGVIATLLDQNAGWYNGVPTQFFNQPACTKKGLAKLVNRTKAAVVPAFMIREGNQYILEFFPEIHLETGDCPIKDIEKNTQNYVTAIEKMVRIKPEQYFWVHNRWKTKSYSLINNH